MSLFNKISIFCKREIIISTRDTLFFLFFLFFYLGNYNISLSQTAEIDSIKILSNISSGTKKSTSLLLLAKKYKMSNYDSVLKYADKALNYSLQINDNPTTIKALMLLSYININLGDNERAAQFYSRAKRKCIDDDNYHLLAEIYLDLGKYNIKLSNYSRVTSCLDTALNIINANNISHLRPIVYLDIGRMYLLVNYYVVARYYANMALDYSLVENDKANYFRSLLLVGDIYLQEDNMDSSLFLFNIALELARSDNNKLLILRSYRRMANYYLKKKALKTTSQYIDSSIVICKELQLINELAALITYKAHVLTLKNDYKGALECNFKALKLRKTSGHKLAICSSLLNIGGDYTELGDYKSAQEFLDKGIKIAESQEVLFYLDYGYGKLSNLYRATGNYKKALYYSDLERVHRDSMMISKSHNEVLFFKSQYELEKQKTISEKIKLKKKANEQIFLIITIILSLIVIILLIRFVYVKRKSTKEIVKLSRIIETTTQAVIILNPSGKVFYVNNGLLNMLGFLDKNELIGKSINDFIDPEEKGVLKNEIVPALITNGHWNGEMLNMKKDKSLFTSEVICSIITKKDNIPELLVAIFNDISVRKEAELALHIIRENLEKTVNTQDKMFSIIAHDLTGPFNSILGLSELMANEYDSYKRDDHIKFSKLIYNSSKHTFDLLTNLLQWSRSQLGNIDLKFDNINIHKLVSKNAELVKLWMIKKEIKFNNEISTDAIAFADYNTTDVVVRNLITNAIKFTQRGGSITVSAIVENANIKIIVADTGVGIVKENIATLFDISSSKTQRGTEDEKGTGLGLVLCKEFVDLNNGTISVESTYGAGTKFIVTLPTS